MPAATNILFAPWNPFSASTIRRVVRTSTPDVAHLHNFWFRLSPSVVVALSEMGVPVVVTVHNYRLVCPNAQLLRGGQPCELCVEGSTWPAIRYACYRGSHIQSVAAAATLSLHRRIGTWTDRVDLFLCLTNFAAEMLARGGVSPRKIKVKPNSVGDPGQRAAQPSASKDVLFVGRISAQKGIANLLEAWKSRGPVGLRLMVIGDGPDVRILENAPPGVFFRGALSHQEVLREMASARALVFPSTSYEGQPLVLLEALASGLPIISSSLGGLPEIVAGGSALAITLPNALSLGSAFDRLSDDVDVDKAGAAARATYLARYTPKNSLHSLEDAYRSLVDVRRGPRQPA